MVTLHTCTIHYIHFKLLCLMFETQTTLQWRPLTQQLQKCYPNCPLTPARAEHNAHCLFLHNLHREKYFLQVHRGLFNPVIGQYSLQCSAQIHPRGERGGLSDICTQLDFILLLSPACPLIGQSLSILDSYWSVTCSCVSVEDSKKK